MLARAIARLLPVLVCLAATGCGGYTLTGRVVEGDFGDVAFVGADNQGFDARGVAGARIAVHRDADRPNRRLVAEARADKNGNFSIPIGEFGAGWMDERWRIDIERGGYETLQRTVSLPKSSADRRTLITLRPGLSLPLQENEDLWDEYERFK